MVTGFPGQAAAGLQLLLHSDITEDLMEHPLVKAYQEPSHRAREGKAIADSGCATAMIHGHGILRAQLRNDACNDRLFSRSKMHFAGDQAVPPQLSDRFLKPATLFYENVK